MKIKNWKIFILTISFMLFICFVFISAVYAKTKNWTPLPPYNLLWPLWSPALSPVDPATDIPIPLITELSSSTELSVRPVLAWNPALEYPYFLFDSPGGLVYYDILHGINFWPPPNMVDPLTGNPIPITLKPGSIALPATDPLWIKENLPVACLAYLAEYKNFAMSALDLDIVLPPNLTGLNPWLASIIHPTPAYSSLLTPADILGY